MKNIYFTILLTIIAQSATTQMLSLDLTLGLPQNQFRENTNAIGFGGDLSLAFPIKEGIPIYVGGDLNYLIYGRNARHEELSAQIVSSDGRPIGDPIVFPLKVVTTNSIFGTHAFMRGYAPTERIVPYVEGLLGFRYISTNTRILDRSSDRRYSNEEDGDLIVRETVLDDWIFSYGYGGGVLIKLSEGVFLDFRANFFKGQRAEYFDGEDTSSWTIKFNGNEEEYDPSTLNSDNLDFSTSPRKSRTDLLMIKFGIVFKT